MEWIVEIDVKEQNPVLRSGWRPVTVRDGSVSISPSGLVHGPKHDPALARITNRLADANG